MHARKCGEATGDYALKRSKPQPPHTGGTLHRRLQPLYTEKHTVSCSGFLPNTSPMQHSCSHYNAFPIITWQTCLYLRTWQQHRTTSPMQHSCSHYNAFCIVTWQTRLYLRTWQQKMTTMMLPFHCDLQPQIPNHPITYFCLAEF